MQSYTWYPMSPTIQKVLVHEFQINNSAFVLLGYLGENSSESQNKLYKSDQLSHVRKNSRINTMSDIFHRAIDSSDPLLSTISLKERERKNRKKPLPKAVISLLEIQSNFKPDPSDKILDSHSDSDSSSDSKIYNVKLEEEEGDS